MKQCAKCLVPRPLTEFGFNARYLTRGVRDGLSIYCKGCCRAGEKASKARKRAMKDSIMLAAKERIERVKPTPIRPYQPMLKPDFLKQESFADVLKGWQRQPGKQSHWRAA